jgi:hypothetical protein
MRVGAGAAVAGIDTDTDVVIGFAIAVKSARSH